MDLVSCFFMYWIYVYIYEKKVKKRQLKNNNKKKTKEMSKKDMLVGRKRCYLKIPLFLNKNYFKIRFFLCVSDF